MWYIYIIYEQQILYVIHHIYIHIYIYMRRCHTYLYICVYIYIYAECLRGTGWLASFRQDEVVNSSCLNPSFVCGYYTRAQRTSLSSEYVALPVQSRNQPLVCIAPTGLQGDSSVSLLSCVSVQWLVAGWSGLWASPQGFRWRNWLVQLRPLLIHGPPFPCCIQSAGASSHSGSGCIPDGEGCDYVMA